MKTRSKSIGARSINLGKKSNEFHEFAMEWEPHRIRFFTNGLEVFRYTNKKVLNTMTLPQHVLINNNVQPKYLKEEEYQSYYSIFGVDYIRVYQKSSQL